MYQYFEALDEAYAMAVTTKSAIMPWLNPNKKEFLDSSLAKFDDPILLAKKQDEWRWSLSFEYMQVDVHMIELTMPLHI